MVLVPRKRLGRGSAGLCCPPKKVVTILETASLQEADPPADMIVHQFIGSRVPSWWSSIMKESSTTASNEAGESSESNDKQKSGQNSFLVRILMGSDARNTWLMKRTSESSAMLIPSPGSWMCSPSYLLSVLGRFFRWWIWYLERRSRPSPASVKDHWMLKTFLRGWSIGRYGSFTSFSQSSAWHISGASASIYQLSERPKGWEWISWGRHFVKILDSMIRMTAALYLFMWQLMGI